MDNNKEKCFLFFSNQETTFAEKDNLVFHRFLDISNNKRYTFLWKNHTLYVVVQLNSFGSIFVGNYIMGKLIY